MKIFKIFRDGRKKNLISEEQMETILECLCKSPGWILQKKTEQAKYEPVGTKKILRKQNGWVGTRKGRKGFDKLTADELKDGEFEFSGIEPDRRFSLRWIPLKEFREICVSKGINTKSP
jgi:hypothetical protein